MYIVLEIQTNIDDSIGTIINTYTRRENAESRYHEVLMYAALSSLPVHSAVLLDNKGSYLKNETFIHNSDGNDQEE